MSSKFFIDREINSQLQLAKYLVERYYNLGGKDRSCITKVDQTLLDLFSDLQSQLWDATMFNYSTQPEEGEWKLKQAYKTLKRKVHGFDPNSLEDKLDKARDLLCTFHSKSGLRSDWLTYLAMPANPKQRSSTSIMRDERDLWSRKDY